MLLITSLITSLTPSLTTGQAPIPFISTWNTANIGASNNNQITLPLESSGAYNFLVDWGEDIPLERITAFDDPGVTHTYASSGTYTVTITGIIKGWSFNNAGDPAKLTQISQVGSLQFGNSGGYFYGCANLDWSATDIPNLSGTTTMADAFRDCDNIILIPNIELWNILGITNWTGAFRKSNFAGPISGWGNKFRNVINVANMFRDNTTFNKAVEDLDFSSVENALSFLFGALAFNKPVNNLNTSSLLNWGSFLRNTNFNRPMNNLDFSAATNVNNLLRDSNFSQTNYDPLLISFDAQSLNSNLNFHAGTAKYGAGAPATARANRISDGWTMTDGGAA